MPYYHHSFRPNRGSSSISSLIAATTATTAVICSILVCVFWSVTVLTTTSSNVLALAMTAPSQQQRTVLVTGGAGYIGSHTCLELLKAPNQHYKVIVVDNLDNSSEESIQRVRELLQDNDDEDDTASDNNNSHNNRIEFRNCDVRDKERLNQVLEEFPEIDSCIHFAGLKAVGESMSKPLEYYDCNIGGTITLLQCLQQHKVHTFVFSSSATVYGEPEMLPLTETARLSATNPYGRTKLYVEELLRDTHKSDPSNWNIVILRYFNPIGAHPSGRIGEDPQGIPNNLMPYIAQVCVGRRPFLQVFGGDYNTPDGTGVRDYIHVVDLAKGHVAALDKLYSSSSDGDDDSSTHNTKKSGGGGCCEAVNLGTGCGVSVLELVEGMAQATGNPVPYKIVDRRAGDVATMYADPTRAQTYLNWSATLGVTEMCQDTWKWQSTNPYGYTTPPQEMAVTTKEATEEDEVIETSTE